MNANADSVCDKSKSKQEFSKTFNKKYLQWIEGKEHFNKWLVDTTFHGIVHVFKSQSLPRRILWGMIFLVGVSGCLFTIIDQIIRYSGFPSSTTVSLVRGMEGLERGLEFPAVTICNINFAKKSAADTNNFTGIASDFQSLDYLSCLIRDCSNTTSLRDVLFDVRQPLGEFLRECYFVGFDGMNDTILTDCGFVPTLTDAGYCYTFNGNNTRKLYVRNTGSRYGLHLTLNINQSEYLPSTEGAGVRVAIHPRGEPPEPEDKGIAVAPQQSAFIGLRTTRVDDTSTGKTCEDHGCVTFFSDYSVAACTLNHYYKLVAERCGCIATINDTQMVNTGCTDPLRSIPNVESLRNCTICDSCCMIEQVFYTSPSNVCPSSCNYTTFETSISYSSHLSNTAAMALAEEMNMTVNEVKDNFLSVNIFFEELYLETITTTDSFSFTSLLSSIGGQLGLFLGASVISIIELIWFFIDDIIEVFQRCFCQKKHQWNLRPNNSSTVAAVGCQSDVPQTSNF